MLVWNDVLAIQIYRFRSFSLTIDFAFITLNACLTDYEVIKEKGNEMSTEISNTLAAKAAVDAIKKRKSTEKIEVSIIERSHEDWVIRGTCPIDMEGHPWAEKFEVVIDPKGKVKSVDFALL
jgi:hypothetical protein